MKLSIIIVNHNANSLLDACLASIVSCVPETLSYEVIVVENGSLQPYSMPDRLNSNRFRVLDDQGNHGFSRANNRGLARSTGEYVLFLNPDTVLRAGVVDSMVEFMEHHIEVGASSCRVELPDGALDDAAHRGFPTPWNSFCYFSGVSKLFPHVRLLSGYNMTWALSEVAHEVDAVAGCFMLVRRIAGDEVGWWDEDYFFYGEDLDLCFRLREAGWKTYFVPSASILHLKGMSSGIKDISRRTSTASAETRMTATRARFAAMRLFYDKHYAETYPRAVRLLVLTGISIKEHLELVKLSLQSR